MIGYRVAQIALRELHVERAEDEELVAICENDACGVDAVQVLTGCTAGKGNLILRDWGKQVFTFGRRSDGNLLRVCAAVGLVFQDPDDQLFCPIVFDDVASGPIYQGLPEREVRVRVQQALDAVCMGHMARRVHTT